MFGIVLNADGSATVVDDAEVFQFDIMPHYKKSALEIVMTNFMQVENSADLHIKFPEVFME